MTVYNVEMRGVLDVQVEASSEEQAIEMLRQRFARGLPYDEMQGHKLPNGGEVLGFKAEEYEVWDEFPSPKPFEPV